MRADLHGYELYVPRRKLWLNLVSRGHRVPEQLLYLHMRKEPLMPTKFLTVAEFAEKVKATPGAVRYAIRNEVLKIKLVNAAWGMSYPVSPYEVVDSAANVKAWQNRPRAGMPKGAKMADGKRGKK